MNDKLNSICNDLEKLLKGLENKIQLVIDTRTLIKISKNNENNNIIMNNLFKIEDQLREICGILNKTLLYHNKEKINLEFKNNFNLIDETSNNNNFNNNENASNNLNFDLIKNKEQNNFIKNNENIINDLNKKEENLINKNNNINNIDNQTNIINSTNNNNFPITINNIQIYE